LAIDSAGDLFVSETPGGSIIEITPGGMQTTFASGLGSPRGLAVDRTGDLFVGVPGEIIEITPGGSRSIFASLSDSEIPALAFQPVPEPRISGLLAIGAACLLLRRREAC